MPSVLAVAPTTTAVSIEFNLGDTFTLTFPLYDATGAQVSAVGFSAKAVVLNPGTGTAIPGIAWSTTAGSAVCGASGVALSFVGATTSTWTWTSGTFALAVANTSGAPSLLASGPILALPQLVPFPIS